MIRYLAALIVVSCLFGLPDAQAQTLQSITITGLGPTGTGATGQLQTGGTATLTAIGNFINPASSQPILVNWSSSNPALVSVNSNTGTVTGLAGTIAPVTITATSGAAPPQQRNVHGDAADGTLCCGREQQSLCL